MVFSIFQPSFMNVFTKVRVVLKPLRTGTVLATVLVFTAALIIWLQNKILNKGRFQIIAGKSFRPIEVKLRGLRNRCLLFAYSTSPLQSYCLQSRFSLLVD